MKQLTIFKIGTYYSDNKVAFVKLIKDTTGLDLKGAKDIADDIFSELRKNVIGTPVNTKLENIDDVVFMANVHPTLEYSICDYKNSNIKESPRKVLESLMLTTAEIELIVEQNEQLKQENHELTKEVRSLKSTLYRTAVDLNKQYQATNELINRSGPRASHIIKDLANDIRENDDASEATKDC